jgi:hypothetical protein
VPIDERVLSEVADALGRSDRSSATDRGGEIRGLQWLLRQVRILDRIAALDGERLFRTPELNEIAKRIPHIHPEGNWRIRRELRASHLFNARTRNAPALIAVLRGWEVDATPALHTDSLDFFDRQHHLRESTAASIIAGESIVRPDVLQGHIIGAHIAHTDEAAAYRELLPLYFSTLHAVQRYQSERQQPVTLLGVGLSTWVNNTEEAIGRLDSGPDFGLRTGPLR